MKANQKLVAVTEQNDIIHGEGVSVSEETENRVPELFVVPLSDQAETANDNEDQVPELFVVPIPNQPETSEEPYNYRRKDGPIKKIELEYHPYTAAAEKGMPKFNENFHEFFVMKESSLELSILLPNQEVFVADIASSANGGAIHFFREGTSEHTMIGFSERSCGSIKADSYLLRYGDGEKGNKDCQRVQFDLSDVHNYVIKEKQDSVRHTISLALFGGGFITFCLLAVYQCYAHIDIVYHGHHEQVMMGVGNLQSKFFAISEDGYSFDYKSEPTMQV